MKSYRVIHKTFNAVAGGQLVIVEAIIECDAANINADGSLAFYKDLELIKAIPAGAWVDLDRVEKAEKSVLES